MFFSGVYISLLPAFSQPDAFTIVMDRINDDLKGGSMTGLDRLVAKDKAALAQRQRLGRGGL